MDGKTTRLQLLRRGGSVQIEKARPGILVVDSSLEVIACNEEGLQILTFQLNSHGAFRTHKLLMDNVRFCFRGHSGNGASFACKYRSGRRTYNFQILPLSKGVKLGPCSPAYVILFELRVNDASRLSAACSRFGLTHREQQTIELLLQGLAGKEIADRMHISPNTVKSFIRLVMVKMGVSTRAALVAKILGGSQERSGVPPVDMRSAS